MRNSRQFPLDGGHLGLMPRYAILDLHYAYNPGAKQLDLVLIQTAQAATRKMAQENLGHDVLVGRDRIELSTNGLRV